jgi:hypothetical protein
MTISANALHPAGLLPALAGIDHGAVRIVNQGLIFTIVF